MAGNGFPGRFGKMICTINFKPNYPYGTSLWTPIHFWVSIVIFVSPLATNMAETGSSVTLWKHYLFNSIHTWHLSCLCAPIQFHVPILSFGPLPGGQIFGICGFGKLFEKLFSQFIWYLPCTLIAWVSGSLSIFVILPSSRALWWPNIWAISWIFLDKASGDQSGGILFPFMSKAGSFCFAKL